MSHSKPSHLNSGVITMNRKLVILSMILLASFDINAESKEDSNKVTSINLVERQEITYEVNSQSPFSGISEDYYENGQLKLRENFNDGKRNGLSLEYYENGQLWGKAFWKDGNRDGLTESYQENGQRLGSNELKDGVVHGITKMYFESGQLRSIMNYKDGYLDGLTEMYQENGQLMGKRCFKKSIPEDMSYCDK